MMDHDTKSIANYFHQAQRTTLPALRAGGTRALLKLQLDDMAVFFPHGPKFYFLTPPERAQDLGFLLPGQSARVNAANFLDGAGTAISDLNRQARPQLLLLGGQPLYVLLSERMVKARLGSAYVRPPLSEPPTRATPEPGSP